MKISFFLRKDISTIYVDISWDGYRLRKSTQEFCPKYVWIGNKDAFVSDEVSYSSLNEKLNTLKEKLTKFLNEAAYVPFPDEVTAFCDTLILPNKSEIKKPQKSYSKKGTKLCKILCERMNTFINEYLVSAPQQQVPFNKIAYRLRSWYVKKYKTNFMYRSYDIKRFLQENFLFRDNVLVGYSFRPTEQTKTDKKQQKEPTKKALRSSIVKLKPRQPKLEPIPKTDSIGNRIYEKFGSKGNSAKKSSYCPQCNMPVQYDDFSDLIISDGNIDAKIEASIASINKLRTRFLK